MADTLTALTTEGAAFGPPLVVPVAIGASDLSDALEQAYQDDLAAAQIMRRRTADAAALAHDIRSQITELESLRDQLSEQRQRALDEDMPEPELSPGGSLGSGSARLLWDMHKHVDHDAIPPGRTVVQFTFPDVPPAPATGGS